MWYIYIVTADDNIYTDDDEDGRNSNSTPKPLRWYDLNANMTDYLKSVQVSIINAQTEVNAKISFNGGLNRFWIDPPNPNIKIWNGYQSGKAPDPKHYYRRRVYVWAPHLILPALVLSCPKCGNRGKVDAKSFTTSGWGDRPRIVYGLGDYYFLIFQMYLCRKDGCAKKLSSISDEVMEALPYFVANF